VKWHSDVVGEQCAAGGGACRRVECAAKECSRCVPHDAYTQGSKSRRGEKCPWSCLIVSCVNNGYFEFIRCSSEMWRCLKWKKGNIIDELVALIAFIL